MGRCAPLPARSQFARAIRTGPGSSRATQIPRRPSRRGQADARTDRPEGAGRLGARPGYRLGTLGAEHVTRPELATGRRSARGACLAGSLAAFVAAVGLVRGIRPALLLSSEPSWAAPRLLLGIALLAAAAAVGGLFAAGFLLWSRTPVATAPLEPLSLPRGALLFVSAAALIAGTALRFARLAELPPSLWVDDASLVEPALRLTGAPSDFRDAIRPVPWGVVKQYGSIGVLYLEGYRLCLTVLGTTVFGVRFPSALAGAISIATAMLLARALLPRGGGALAGLALAGMRWSLIVSRWGWSMIALAPIADTAALLLVAARRRRAAVLAAAAGAVAGIGAHVYLSAWVVAAALAVLAFWPRERERIRSVTVFGATFLAGFLAAAAPLFLLSEGRAAPYFARTRDHNLALEIRRQRSPLPGLAAAARALAGPWLLADPSPRNDLPGRPRLGWILGIPVAVALGRALLRPREDFSAFLLAQAGAALAAAVVGGEADSPNGSRFAYLTTVAGVAASAGALALAGAVPPGSRRTAAVVAAGLFAVGGAFGARDALVEWPARRETFDGFHGQDTLIGRAAARWSEFGGVSVDRGLGHSPVLLDTVVRYRLDPDRPREGALGAGNTASRRFRVAAADTPIREGERRVERIVDAWGRAWGVVLGTRRPEP
jgi:Dolichyl-phosphate-mannose-protein mannosyltransferase